MSPTELEELMDRHLLEGEGAMTCGAAAFHALAPDEKAMRHEEEGEDTGALDAELWAARTSAMVVALDFLFGEGPHPAAVRARVQALVENFAGTLRVSGRLVWWEEVLAVAVLKRRLAHLPGSLHAAAAGMGAWWAEVSARGEEEAGVASEVMERLCRFLASEGASWKTMTASAYGLAKALRPDLLGGMSLDDIAVLSGDKGRATPQARIKRQVTDLMTGFFGRPQRVHFQKGVGASRACAAAQVGNRNRRGSSKLRRAKTH